MKALGNILLLLLVGAKLKSREVGNEIRNCD